MNEKEYNAILDYLTSKEYPKSLQCSLRANWRKKCRRFTVENNLLLYNNLKYHTKCTVIKEDEKLPIIKQIHEAQEKHSGINKTRKEISKKFYWKTINEDVNKYIQICKQCQDITIQRNFKNCSTDGLAQSGITPESKFQIQALQSLQNEIQEIYYWHLEIIDLFPEKTHRGNQYLILMIHSTYNWIEGKAIDRKESTEEIGNFIIECIYKHSFIQNIRVSQKIWSDDINFIPRLYNILQSLYPNIKEVITKANCDSKIIDVFIKLIQKCSNYIKDFYYYWDKYLDQIIFSFNSFGDNDLSPFRLLYNKSPNLPFRIDNTSHNDDIICGLWKHTSKLLIHFSVPISNL